MSYPDAVSERDQNDAAPPEAEESAYQSDGDEIVISESGGEQTGEGTTTDLPTGGDHDGDQQSAVPTLASLFEATMQQQPPTPSGQSQTYQPSPQQMPSWYDQRYTDPGQVKLEIDRQRLEYAAKMQAVDPAFHGSFREAYQNRVEAIQATAMLHQMVQATYQLYQENQTLHNQMAPFQLLMNAEEFAAKYGVDDVGKLLVHPVTKEPITDPRMMAAIASVLGSQTVKRTNARRAGVDQPVNMSGGGARRSLSQIDHRSKQFADIEAAVKSGKRVTFTR